MNVICIMQARCGSTRLPEKVLKILKGKMVLEHDIIRLKQAVTIDEIVVATTNDDRDDQIIDIAKKHSTGWIRGSVDDVLSRYFYAAKKYKADVVIRVTSDCPLIDPQIIDDMVYKFMELNKESHIDYLSNKINMTYPRGLDVEVFSYEVLEKTFKEAKKDYEREHVTPYIYLNADKFKVYSYENDTDYSKYRWTLDTEEDFELISLIYEHLYIEGKIFYFENILEFVKKHPEVSKINEHIRQKELVQ